MLPEYSRENRMKGKGEGAFDTKPGKVMDITYTGEDFESIRKEFQELISQR